MPELKKELLNGIADFRSVLHDLDGCIARIVDAEDDLQRSVQRLARIERRLDPRRLIARLQALAARMQMRLHLAH